MSLPSSESLPNDINDLPPARQRHIRRLPHSATPAERQILLDSLIQLSSPNLTFFLFVLFGALLVGSALYFNSLALLITAIVALPFPQPVFGLGLVPTRLKFGHGLKSLICLLLPLMLVIASGALAGWLQKTNAIDQLGVYRFSSPHWLDLTIVAICAFLGTLILLRQGRLPRLIGVLLSYEIFLPMGAAGYGFILGNSQLWPGSLLVGLLHLTISIFLASFSFLLLGFPPKRASGWLLSLLPLILIAVLLFGCWNLNLQDMFGAQEPTPTSLSTTLPSQTPSPKADATETLKTPSESFTPTQSPSPTHTQTLTPTQTATFTQTPTLEPTTYWGIVDALTGAVVRETPDFEAAVVTYANDGDQIEILREVEGEDGTRWYEVQMPTGETGWLLGSLIDIPTPTSTP